MDDLELPDELWEPEMGSIERPETLLVVKDEEVTKGGVTMEIGFYILCQKVHFLKSTLHGGDG